MRGRDNSGSAGAGSGQCSTAAGDCKLLGGSNPYLLSTTLNLQA